MEYHLKKKLENRRRHKNEDYHRKNHNRHSNIDLSTVLVCNFVINNAVAELQRFMGIRR